MKVRQNALGECELLSNQSAEMLCRNCEREKRVGTNCCPPVLAQGVCRGRCYRNTLVRAVCGAERLNRSKAPSLPPVEQLPSPALVQTPSSRRAQEPSAGLGMGRSPLSAGLCRQSWWERVGGFVPQRPLAGRRQEPALPSPRWYLHHQSLPWPLFQPGQPWGVRRGLCRCWESQRSP